MAAFADAGFAGAGGGNPQQARKIRYAVAICPRTPPVADAPTLAPGSPLRWRYCCRGAGNRLHDYLALARCADAAVQASSTLPPVVQKAKNSVNPSPANAAASVSAGKRKRPLVDHLRLGVAANHC